MAFEYAELDRNELDQFKPLLRGPVLALSDDCARDRARDAVLLDLGGKPDLAPERDEPPGHYNLVLGQHVIAAAGYFTVEEDDEGFVTVFDLSLSVPATARTLVDEVKEMVQQGLTVLRSGRKGRASRVRVNYDQIAYF
ncbi:hypothetical protein [Pseudoduganella chitinolytica]|uniref:DUF3168 domain-containing protein n=1 Tax=Pseudoduganella chitinolytica TaxID=34070 RepID=A0ABY8B6S8_9BURK|nr:hypothetical protein [Pseudoduganella chitinolytica]WEF31495.1 hypothetical protein PX653_18790 [Pseudoduganella chitinolytica]